MYICFLQKNSIVPADIFIRIGKEARVDTKQISKLLQIVTRKD